MTDNRYIKDIIDEIDRLSIDTSELREELIDHYCSFYEGFNGTDQEKLNETFKQINNINLKEFSTNNRRRNTLRIAGVILFLGAMSIAFSYNNQEDQGFYDMQTQFAEIEPGTLDYLDPPYGNPLKVVNISSNYGKRFHPFKKVVKFHHGIDLKAAEGTEIYVVERGTVMDCGYDKLNGNYVEIKHDEMYTTRYHHMKSVLVKKGQLVEEEDIIGEVGSTGLSTAPHLHYEVIKSGEFVDPLDYLKS